MLSYKLFVVKDTIKKIYGKIFTKRNAKIFIMLAIFVGICNLTYYRVNTHDKILQASIERVNEKKVDRIMSAEEKRKEIELIEKIDHDLYHLKYNETCVKKFCMYSPDIATEEMIRRINEKQ